MKVLTIIIFGLTQVSFAQTPVEERALKYFLEKIYPEEHPELPKLRFNKRTEDSFTVFGVSNNCFDKFDYQFKIDLDNIGEKNSDKSKHKIRLNGHKQNFGILTKYQLRVFKATRLRDFDYVLIAVYRNHYEDFFIIELNSDNIVTRHCKNSVVY
jgi:hypothetical protein